jgi:hypothetical protein
MNAGLMQTSKPSSLEIQTHRNVDPLLRKQVVQLEAAQVIEKIGGRGRDRTGGPLLAKQVLSQLSYTPIFQPTDSALSFTFYPICSCFTQKPIRPCSDHRTGLVNRAIANLPAANPGFYASPRALAPRNRACGAGAHPPAFRWSGCSGAA